MRLFRPVSPRRLLLAILVLVMLINGCGPAPPEPPPEFVDREAQVAVYTASELGASTIELFPVLDRESPYCLDGCLSLDPHWHGNRINPRELPQSPIDLRHALGVTATTPDLKIVYSVADELFLWDGSKVSYHVNGDLSVNYCLNNPGLSIAEGDTCSQYVDRDPDGVLALEKDFYGRDEQYGRFSGTVIFAKRITVFGSVQTEGYDLVLVTDDLEFRKTASINTTPPERPAGEVYGYGKDGYRGGDVVIFARNVVGRIDVNTTGGRGQRGKDGFDPNPSSLGARYCEIDESTADTLLNPSSCMNVDDGLWDHRPYEDCDWLHGLWVFDGLYEYKGEAGRSGRGGDAGHITIITTGNTFSKPDALQGGGPAGIPGETAGPKPHDYEAVLADPEAEFPFKPDPSQDWDGTWIDEEIEHGHGSLLHCTYYTDPQGVNERASVLNIPHRHCNAQRVEVDDDVKWMALDCVRYPDEFKIINQAHVEPGQPGELSIVHVDVPFNLLPYEEADDSFVTSPKLEDALLPTVEPVRTAVPPAVTFQPMPTVEIWQPTPALELFQPPQPTETIQSISNLDFATLQHPLVPRAAESLTLKGDSLFRSLSDQDLLDNDATFLADSDRNPLGYNRIDKARHLYASAAFFCVDAIESNLPETEAAANPYWPDCAYALAQKRKLEAGLNYLGFQPGYYLYAKPTVLHRPFDVLRNYIDEHYREDFGTAKTNLDNAEETGIDTVWDTEKLALEQQIAAKSVGVMTETLEAAATSLHHTLVRIEENTKEITHMRQAISTTLTAIQEATEPPPCDWWCWTKKVFKVAVNIGSLVSDLLSFDFGGLFDSLENAIRLITDAQSFLGGIEAVYHYADLLINGETDSFLFETSEEGRVVVVVEDGAFKKDVIERGESIYDNANELIEGIEDISSIGENPLAEKIVGIRNSSERMNADFQEILTQIYALQAAVQGNEEAYGLARTLEDYTKQLQSLNREIPELQRQHVEAAAEIVVHGEALKLARMKVEQAEMSYEHAVAVHDRYREAVAHAEVMVDGTCRNARAINDRLLLLQYLYQRSIAYVWLDPEPPGISFNRNILDDDDFEQIAIEDLDRVSREVVNWLGAEQQGVFEDIIAPVQYDVRGPDQFKERTPAEIAEVLHPPSGNECPQTEAAYEQAMLSNLETSGVMSFEIYPCHPALGQADREVNKKRVLDVYARILMDDWPPPYGSINHPSQQINHWLYISHGARATFLMDDGALEDFYFPPEAPRTACRAVEATTETDLHCESIRFFVRTVNETFSGIDKAYEDLNTVTVDDFAAMGMYGTSLRGVWTLDITPLLDALEEHQSQNPDYSGCTDEAPCTAVEEFWQEFRGIQYKIFYVPAP